MLVAFHGLLLAETLCLCLYLNDHCVMDESIYGRYCHYAVCKDLVPVTKGVVGGDDDTSGLIAVGNKFEEYMGFRLTLFDITNVV